MSRKPYDIRQRTYLFARDCIALGRHTVTLRDFVLNRLVYQLVDAAGSVGANLEEAGDGQTKPDFINKNAIALKEVREAKFWLQQLRDAEPKHLGLGHEAPDRGGRAAQTDHYGNYPQLERESVKRRRHVKSVLPFPFCLFP